MKLAIDAIDLLHQKQLDGFCIASSDSDFTTLANRIREDGLTVFGFGEEKATAPYVAACNRFFYCDLLLQEEKGARSAEKLRPSRDIMEEIMVAVDDAMGDDGWAHLGAVGSVLSKRKPDFDARNFGFKKLSDLLQSMDTVELTRETTENGTMVRVRRR
jgi:hypothetical protein